MNLLFQVGQYTPIDRLIVAATGGPECHVELQLESGECFSSQYPGGVHLYDEIDTCDSKVWKVMPLDCFSWVAGPNVLGWMRAVVGQPYDFVGAVSAGIGSSVELSGHWFCSEIVIEALSRCGAIGIPPLLNPTALAGWIEGMKRGDTQEELEAMVKQHYLLREKLTAQRGFAESEEESLVRGWRTQIEAGFDPKRLNQDIKEHVCRAA